ncbi:hypothetical protein PG991_001635 [Apiospora marii]|uniref:chitinase n=1 Tax=Apiospora marii TaxID=335849 RepID=A0ABR1SSJ5_9PEZI
MSSWLTYAWMEYDSYYESWAPYKRGACTTHPRPPSWIRKDSITHLNVAFGYIQPSTFQVSPDLSSEEILLEIMDLKQDAPGLKIYISLGGWTYSDNDTDTQPVWGDLASSSQKRQQFIGNLANFMVHYGFDGVDLDWEYPGAPDRGGKDRDIDNFVDLVRDIRDYWSVNGQGWGLSFTAPTSYWYMRWFDVEALSKYVDWINLMTYDLHGSWDSPEDQIGSFVYAHTNLTEIQHALDLLWRNNVPANKVNLGLGFYGRSYTLEDPSCSLPGCPFTSGGRAGACTGESGILSFQEISELVDKNIKPVRDDKAAAMYVAFDQDQWVSYDNVQTIKEKVDFANKNGLLGLFIWALDLDNDNYDALAAVLDSRGGLGTFGKQNGTLRGANQKLKPRLVSTVLSAWMIGMAALNNKEFNQEVNLPDHHVKDTFPFYIFSEDLQCKVGGIPFNAYCRIWADLHIDIQTSAQLTLIGRLDNLDSWKQSHVLFRNKGSIQAGLHMSALAQLRFSTGPLEIFGMANFGSAFKVPGLVTIGPNLRVMGEIIGVFTVHADAHYDLEVSSWDYTQRYPNPDNDVLSGLTQESKMDKEPSSQPDSENKPFRADVGINGDLTFKVTPLVEFGIRWNQKYKVQDTVLSLQLNTYATLFGSAGVGTDTAASVCYGAVCGVDLFAQLEGPTIFGVNPNRRHSFYKKDFNIVEETCKTIEAFTGS